MYPALASLVSPPDPYAGGSAPVSQVISQELLADFKEVSSGKERLSDAIERQIEDRDAVNQLLEAQEDHAEAQENAQETRVEGDGISLISTMSPGLAAGSSSASGGINSVGALDHGGSSAGKAGHQAGSGKEVQQSAVVNTRPAAAPPAVPAAAQPLRQVPAAVLRALEVESSLQLGLKTSTSTSSTTRSAGGLRVHQGSKNMAPSELRTLQGMTSLMAQRGGRLRIQLEPLQLGPVTIDVDVQGSRVRATIETTTRAAQRVLEAATSRLRGSLESQGYTLDRLDVRPEGSGSTATAEPDSPEEEQHQSRETRDEGGSRHERHSSKQKQPVGETISFADAQLDIAIQEQDS